MAFGAGEAAGDGLVAGFVAELGVVAGAAGVVLLGEAAVAGADELAGVFEFELVAGSSVQPTAKAIARIPGSSSAVRLIRLLFEILIVFPRSSKFKKRADNCPSTD